MWNAHVLFEMNIIQHTNYVRKSDGKFPIHVQWKKSEVQMLSIIQFWTKKKERKIDAKYQTRKECLTENDICV